MHGNCKEVEQSSTLSVQMLILTMVLCWLATLTSNGSSGTLGVNHGVRVDTSNLKWAKTHVELGVMLVNLYLILDRIN